MPDLDDVILPDDYEAPPEAQESEQEETVEVDETQVEDTKPTDEQPSEETVTPEEARLFKLKYDKEEMELPEDEVRILAQKGLNYERAVERAKQEARDTYIAEQGYTWNGKPITTEADYKQALYEQSLKDKDLPDEVVQELMESRKDREERQKEKEQKAEQDQKNAMLNDFLGYFSEVNGRPFDASKDKIPKEVRDAVDKGEALKTAYMQHHNKELINQLKIAKQNEENLKRAPVGSVTVNGGTKAEPEDAFMRGFNSID